MADGEEFTHREVKFAESSAAHNRTEFMEVGIDRNVLVLTDAHLE